jgi:hypothetical protein
MISDLKKLVQLLEVGRTVSYALTIKYAYAKAADCIVDGNFVINQGSCDFRRRNFL